MKSKKKLTHRFEAKHHRGLESQYRRRILPPTKILKSFGLRRGMKVADVGAGTGYFLIPAARIAGQQGKAYAIDVSEEMLRILSKKRLPRNTVIVHSSDGYSFDVLSSEVDFAVASAILHENDPDQFLREVRRIMKRHGKLLIIEWKKTSQYGPPSYEKLEQDDVVRILRRNRFRPIISRSLNARYYAVLSEKA
ncbi:MAG: class I SAM-dependent methyltransferase [Candidatus Kryptoniota bacterium]